MAEVSRVGTTSQSAVNDVDVGGLTLDMVTAPTAAAAAAGAEMEVPRLTQLSIIQTVVLSIMFVVALIGNSATLARMYRMRRRRSTINLLLTHLATADLIVTFFCNVTEAVWTSTIQWLAGNAACKIIKFLQVHALVHVLIAVGAVVQLWSVPSRHILGSKTGLQSLRTSFLLFLLLGLLSDF